MNTIPKGYQLHVTSWENDGDNYKTEVLSGIQDLNDVKFLVQVAQDLASRPYGNSYVPDEKIDFIIRNNMELHSISDGMRKKLSFGEDYTFEDRVDMYYEGIIVDLLGYPVDYDSMESGGSDIARFCRMYESHKLYYIPEDIVEIRLVI